MERDIIKFIDGEIYYYYDYANFLYKELEKRDKGLFIIERILKSEYKELTDYGGDEYKKEMIDRILDIINKIKIVGGNDNEVQNEQYNV